MVKVNNVTFRRSIVYHFDVGERYRTTIMHPCIVCGERMSLVRESINCNYGYTICEKCFQKHKDKPMKNKANKKSLNMLMIAIRQDALARFQWLIFDDKGDSIAESSYSDFSSYKEAVKDARKIIKIIRNSRVGVFKE